jgi:hypothetical protein
MNLASCDIVSCRKANKCNANKLQNFLRRLLPPICLFVCMQALVSVKCRTVILCGIVDQRNLQSLNGLCRVEIICDLLPKSGNCITVSSTPKLNGTPRVFTSTLFWQPFMKTELHEGRRCLLQATKPCGGVEVYLHSL